jgi:hypothetical protein
MRKIIETECAMTPALTFPVGTKVIHRGTGEIGIVIHTWPEEEMQCDDCYVAFFGYSFPVGKPDEIPYVLRYLATSLEALP